MNRYTGFCLILLLMSCSTYAADPPAKAIPKVGVPFLTSEQYKPVVGKRGGQLVLDSLGEPKSFNPVVAAETSTTTFTGRMFQGLTESDAFTGDVKPLLAEKWEVAGDGVTWTFHLRKDVTFNDGSPFTSRDVVFTWNDLVYDLSRPDKSKDPRWPCSMANIATFDGQIVKVEAVDDYTVKFVTPVKVAIWDQLAAMGILSQKKYAPLVADGSFGGAMGADAKPEDLVGTGPFMLGEYVRGDHVTLKRNPKFWKKDAAGNALPYLDAEVFLIVKDQNISLLHFQRQETDVYGLRSGKDVGVLRPKQDADNFTLYQLGPDYGTSFVAFNMNSDAAREGKVADYKVNWFRDARFRQAISYGIDRGALVKNVMRNLGYPLPGPFTMGTGPFVQEGYQAYAYDPAKAKALLAEMGLKEKNGVLQDDQGHKVSFTINTNSGNDVREETANFVRTDLSKLGMEVNTLPLEFNLLVEKLNRTYDWECVVMGFTGGLDPHWGANVWKSSGRLHMWWPNQKTPGFAWEKRIDEIFLNGIQELDKTKRKQLYREWVDIVYKEQPEVFTVVGERVIALRRKFGNIFPSNAPSNPLLHNEEEIFLLDAAK